MRELFLAFLAQHDDAAWLRAVDRIEDSIHAVDRAATKIWFHFYPLALQRLMQRPDARDLARRMTLSGRWQLAEQIDDSHRFLFGHQYWPAAKRVVLEYVDGPTPPSSLDLGAQMTEMADQTADALNVSAELTTGITAVALRTLQQVGFDAFEASEGVATAHGAYRGLSAERVLSNRERGPAKTLFGLFGTSRQSEVSFDERVATAKFPIIHSQHLTTAAALDTRDYRTTDQRCTEGPIPVDCRSCSCGTCWVGVLGGAAAMSPMDERERSKLEECGVNDPRQSPIRLSCMTQAEGPVSIVIPPWNGLLGRILKQVG